MTALKKNIDYDLLLEESILGICLMEPLAFGSVANILTEDCFYDLDHMDVFKVIRTLFTNGYPIDMITILRGLSNAGVMEIRGNSVASFLVRLSSSVVTSAHLEYWAIMLRQLMVQRKMIALTSSGMQADDPLDAVAKMEGELKKIMDIRTTNDWVHISTTSLQLSTHMDDVKGKEVGLTTGFSKIDLINGGFRPGQLIVLGARPGVGKSAIMGRIATRAANKGATVGIISLEMEGKDILGRITSAESHVDFYKIDRNELEDEYTRKSVFDAMSRLAILPIYFSDTAQVNMFDIRAKADKLKRTHGLNMLIIDYLQLIEPESDKKNNREQEVAKMSRGLKLLAMTLKIPIIILAQLNRQVSGSKDAKPQLHHLRESGAIEQDADIVMFLHRDYLCEGMQVNSVGASTESEADLLIRKWRNGATMDIKLGFEKEKMRFYDIDEERERLWKLKRPSSPFAGINPMRQLPKEGEETPF